VAAAYERRSLGVANHWPFNEWGRFLPDETTAVSLVDRLLHHAVVVVTAGESFRMREARTRGGLSLQEPPSSRVLQVSGPSLKAAAAFSETRFLDLYRSTVLRRQVGTFTWPKPGTLRWPLTARGNPEAARLVYRWLLGYGLVVTLQVVAVWDMVFKQGS
jgi:hypothetical protein